MKSIVIDSTYGIVIHRNFIPLFADEKYAQTFGFESVNDVMNLSSLFEIIDPKFHELAQQSYNDVMSEKDQPKVRSYVNQDTNGRIFSVLTVDHIVEWEGEPALQITVIDMSAIDETNHKILEQEQKYKDLIWNSLQGIVVHRHFKPLMVNPAFVRIIGAKSVAEVMAMESFKFIIPEYNQEHASNLHYQLISGDIENTNSVVENIRLDGKSRFFQLFESVIDWDGELAVQSSIIDVTEKYHLERKIEFQAKHDDLTGLLNRRAITEFLLKEQEEHLRPSQTCLLIDIDNFKLINDQFGHSAGDSVIQQFAELCSTFVKDNGVIGRWGGEEFIIFFPQLNVEQANNIAEKIRYACEEVHFIFNDIQHSITVSIGISTCLSTSCSIEALVQNADNNMYQAKQQGKNQIVLPKRLS